MRWKYRPEGSNWGDYGPNDQLGRLNLLTEEGVLKAAKEIKTGKTFCLSLPSFSSTSFVQRFTPALSSITRFTSF